MNRINVVWREQVGRKVSQIERDDRLPATGDCRSEDMPSSRSGSSSPATTGFQFSTSAPSNELYGYLASGLVVVQAQRFGLLDEFVEGLAAFVAASIAVGE
jgi:hypothetical protein